MMPDIYIKQRNQETLLYLCPNKLKLLIDAQTSIGKN